MAKSNPLSQPRGLTGAAAAVLGLAVYGAWQWRKSRSAQAKIDGETGDRLGGGTAAPSAEDITVGTNSGATI